MLSGFGMIGRTSACEHEGVTPEIMILAKVLTHWYVPLTITLLTEQIFSTFAASLQAVQGVGAAIIEVCADKVPV